MPVKAAVHCYSNERLNCAQSVLKAFRDLADVSQQEIDDARRLGGGRAENGVCGALHVALRLAAEPGAREAIRRDFVEAAGSEQCRDIRKGKTVSCLQCVELASRLLHEALPG
jgi:hypothetical protein